MAATLRLVAVTFNVQHGRRPDGVVDVAALARACAAFDADVLALQEVDHGNRRSGRVDEAGAVATATGMSCAFGEAIPRYGNALLARGTLADVEVLALPHSPDREPRCVILARAMGVSIACAHLGLRGDALSQLPVVVEALSDRPGPHLLLGDLNLDPELVDVSPLMLVDGRPTFPARRPRRRIDHVAVAGLVATRVEVLAAQSVSDHRPLLVELSP